MDFVVAVERLPVAGETVLGRDFRMVPGGKGANQACASGKLGGTTITTRMVGRVGQDVFGDRLKGSLEAAGVEVSGVQATHGDSTGVGLICVERSGQNAIVVASGANRALIPPDVQASRHVFAGARFVLLQLESPLETVSAALRLARLEGAETILDPAPAQPLPPELLANVDILTPNEAEALMLLGLPPGCVSLEEAAGLARSLRGLGPNRVVLKLGQQGCFYWDGENEIDSPGFPVGACDTTAAGDVFNAALAVALAEGHFIEYALRFANAAAAISVTRFGAQASVPERAEVDAFLAAC